MAADRIRRTAVACIVAGGAVLIDQTTKTLALAGLADGRRISLLGDLFGLQLAFNPGATLSFGENYTGVITVVGVVMVGVLIVATTRARTTLWAVGIGMILGGAIGNLIDRLFAAPGFGVGHVTDFLAYGTWFIGNLADVAIAAGTCALVLDIWIRRNRRKPEAVDEAGPSSHRTPPAKAVAP